MKLHISRQSIYLLVIAFILMLVVLLFSFLLLIPAGKEYRIDRMEMKKHAMELRQHQEWHSETYEKLKDLQAAHKRAITAYESSFDAKRFVKMNRSYFEELTLSKLASKPNESGFALYEVNATSKIDSPQSFYTFLEGMNKGDWIIGVNFPIHFERHEELILSSFTMKVYGLADETSETTVEKAASEVDK
ncbi:MAG: hypothetical protein U9Q62_06560 [Campylobacterota bacterium]|nr:hypothetical protein [Campylobacterota bacterium]